jgi:hypothetical protein
MRAQVKRIGEAWEYLKKNIVVGTKWKDSGNKEVIFKKRGIKKEWLAWMKLWHKERLDALNAALEEKLEVSDKGTSFTVRFKRWDYGGIFGRAVKVPNCGVKKDTNTMAKRVELLLDAKKNKFKAVDSELMVKAANSELEL